MSKKIKIPAKKELLEIYTKYGESISSLAKLYNTSNPTIRKWLKNYDIILKSHRDVSREVNRSKNKKTPNKETFEKLYLENSIKDLEKIFSVSQATIYQWINELNIETQTLGERVSSGKTISFLKKIPDHNTILHTYSQEKNMEKTAELCNMSVSYLKKHFKENNIKTIKTWSSKKEKEIFEYLLTNDNFGKWEACNRSLIYPFELDIVSHERKIAIEYCGLYWHSEISGNKQPNYHLNKKQMCEKLDYQLITIFDSDDILKVYSFLDHIIGKNKPIYARNTRFDIVENEQSKSFNEKYHMHGNHTGKIKVGLFLDNELVLNASFSKSRYNKTYDSECIRMTSHKNFRIIGGVSKIFKNVIKEYDMKNIITYVDLRYGTGKSYSKSGMSFSHSSPPNYWYFKSSIGILHSRIQFQKHKLKDKLESFDENLTEWENMKANGWDRIWDCGNGAYINNNNKDNIV